MSIDINNWMRAGLTTLGLGIVASIAGTYLYMDVFHPSQGPAQGCTHPDLQINYPLDQQTASAVMDVAGTLNCTPDGTRLWLTVKPPLGTPMGIHPADVVGNSFSGTTVLAAGAGHYQLCATVADRAADQTFRQAVEETPVVGLPALPPTASRLDCVDVILQ